MTDDAYEIMQDIDGNLTPMIVRFAKKHYDNGDEKELKRIQRRLAGIITSCQPMPRKEYDGE